MKQLFFVLMIALSLGACKKKETVTTTPEDGTMTTTTTTTTTSDATPTAVDPNLDQSVKELMNSWNQYMVDYEKAVKAKDAAALTDLNNRLQTIKAKSAELVTSAKINSAETAEKMEAFMKEKLDQIQKISAQ